MTAFTKALRRVAVVVDVPGAPRSLRLDSVEAQDGDGVVVSWSFVDPEVHVGERSGHGRRVRGHLEVASPRPRAAARVWAEVQLAAARAYVRQVDGDWDAGEPYVRRTWTAQEAWDALVAHLREQWAAVDVGDGEVRVRDGGREAVYRLDPEEWAAYLTDPDDAWAEVSELVPVATRTDGPLPLRAVDELEEAEGAGGPVVRLVDGQLVGGPWDGRQAEG